MRILKKKGYYYLQHSFRKDGKVITREIYLGGKIPENLEEIREKFLQKHVKPGLYNQCEKITSGFQKEWGHYPESAKARDFQEIAIAFTYNTNSIEGSTITLEETREILQERIAPNKPLRDIKETEKHAGVFLNMLRKKEGLTGPLLSQWHQEIFGETKKDISGKYRDYRVRVGRHVPPDWQDIPKLMKGLFIFYRKNKNMHPVELSARMHYQFEAIHPFGDGNGRIGRLLMNHILWHSKYPVLIIEKKRRMAYYKALEKGEDKFVQYFFRTYLRAHKKYLK